MRLYNGYLDTGIKLNTRCCPNCNSSNFRETLSLEECPDCGLRCDWSGNECDKKNEDQDSEIL